MALQVWLPLNGTLENKGLSNVSITNNGATVDNNGKIGKCYSFNGSNLYISTNYDLYFNSDNERSLCFWLYVTANSSIFGSNSYLYQIYVLNNTLIFNLWTSSGSDNLKIELSITINKWQHICYTWGEDKLKLYIDGEFKLESTYMINSTCRTRNYTNIGGNIYKRNHGSPAYLSGKLNDVRIYDHALSAKEVKEISKGLILHYKLDDPLATIYDSSGYCNHGNITGTLTTNSDSSRYTASTVFSSYTNYITAESVPNKQNCSISFWFNPNSISNNLIITGHDSTHYVGAMNGSNIYNSGSGQSSKLYVDGVEASSSISGTNIYFNKSLQSGWHHYCFTNVDLSSWTTFKLGGYGSGWPINGKLTDVRVYATVLSVDDVKELYNTSAFVTDNGIFAEYELYEDNLSDVKKRGLLETANFYENGADENYALDTDKTRVASNYIISEDFIEI